MDPFTLLSAGVGVVGLATSLFGGSQQSKIANQEAQVSQQEFGVEKQQNDVRRQAMEMSGRRNQIETLRVSQRARAMAVQAGTNQGAQFGSGMVAGAEHTQSEGLYGLQGINNNLSFGRQMFGLDDNLNSLKSQMAELESQKSTAAGISSIGGSLMKAGPFIGTFGKQMFGGSGGSSYPFDNTNQPTDH